MTERFEKAYKALITAFFEGTLAKFNCACCAVGNIVGESVGKRFTKEEFDSMVYEWNGTKYTKKELLISNLWVTGINIDFSPAFKCWFQNYLEDPNVANTGYSGAELWEVEKAFENNTKIKVYDYCTSSQEDILQDQYNGLVAVFKVLCKLDSITDVDYETELQKKEGLVLC